MIKTVEVKNFQAHKMSSFDFSPGVNVIKGPSHQGKTAAIRAIKWALTNRPATTSLKSWFASKKDEIKVAIEFDDGFIIRRKDKDFNGYVLPDEKFDAIGTAVPDEVNQIARMPDINIQSQHDPYFMIQEGPQTAAKKLNEIIGLEIIDEVLANAVRKVQDRRKRVTSIEADIEQYTSEIKEYDYLDKLGTLIKQIEKDEKELASVIARKAAIQNLKQSIVESQNRNQELKQFLTIKAKYDQLIESAKELRKTKGKQYRLQTAYQSLADHKEHLLHVEDGTVPMFEIERLFIINDKFDDVQSERVSLKTLHTSIVSLRTRKIECAKTLRDAEKQYQKTLSDAGICPTCGQKIENGGHSHESEDNPNGPES